MNLDPNLIKEFANVPAFYNKTSVNYKDKVYTERAWKSISIKLGHPVSELKERMYQLRNRYNLEKRKLESLRYEGIAEPISSWSLYQYLTFLDGHIRPRKSYKSMIARNSDDNEDSYYDLKSAMIGGRSVINHNVIGSISAPVTPGVIGGVTTSGGGGGGGGGGNGGGIGSGQRGRPRKNPINPTIVRTGRRGRPPKRLIECDDTNPVKMNTIKNTNYNNLHSGNNSNINISNAIMNTNNNNHKNNNINNKNITHQHNNQINQMVEVKYEPQDDVMNDNCNNGNNSDVIVDDNHVTINHLDNVDNINNRNLVNNNGDGGGGGGAASGGGRGGNNNAMDMVRIYANGNCGGDGGDDNTNLARGTHGGQDYDSSNDNELKNDSNEYVNPIHFLVDSESEHGNHPSEVHHHRRPQRTNENNSRNLVSIRNINSLKRHPIQSVDELCQYQNRPIKCTRMHQKLPPADKFETYGNFVSASLADLPEQVAFGLMEKFTSDIIKALMDKSINNNNTAATSSTGATATPSAASASHQQSVTLELQNNNNNNNDNRLSTTSQTIAPTTSSASSSYSS